MGNIFSQEEDEMEQGGSRDPFEFARDLWQEKEEDDVNENINNKLSKEEIEKEEEEQPVVKRRTRLPKTKKRRVTRTKTKGHRHVVSRY